MRTRRALDEVALSVELVLISVVQGVALAALADHGGNMLDARRWDLLPFVLTGLFYILVFWSAAIIHAISFVSWPLDLIRNLLYFGASLVQVLTFRHMGHPAAWFAYSTAFFLVVEALYVYDYRVLVARGSDYEGAGPLHRLYAHMVSRQRIEMFVLVPLGTVFNGVAAWSLTRSADGWLLLAVVQLLLAVAFLAILLHSFHDRLRMIGACATEQ